MWSNHEQNSIKYRQGIWGKSETKVRWSLKQGQGPYCSFCVVNGSLSSQEFGVGTTISKIQRSSRTSRWQCEGWFRTVCSNHRTRVISVMDIISRLPGCDGQAADAVSAYTQVKVEDAPIIVQKFRSQNVQIFEYVYHDWNGPNHGPVWKIQSFFLTEICTVILWQDNYGKGNLRRSYWSMAGRKFQIGNVSLYIVKRIILVCVCGRHKAGWKETKSWPNVEKYLWKTLIRKKATSSLDHVYLGCSQRECKTSKDVVDNYRNMFESKISAGGIEKLLHSEKIWSKHFFMVSCDMEGHAQKCVERYCELANKTTQQLHKVATPCMDDHQFKEEEIGSVGDLSNVCAQIVLECLYLGRIGRPDILWSVNKLVRAITKWTRACDKRLARLISHIHHTCEFKQYCHVGNTAQQFRLGLFQDSDFARDTEDSKSTSGGILCIFGSHTFVPISWMCKKQTSVSHSSTGAETISPDAFLRMDGIPALDLWNFGYRVFHCSPKKPIKPKIYLHRELLASYHIKQAHPKPNQNFNQARQFWFVSHVDNVLSNVKFAQSAAMLCVFEDNESVIKMIIKGRSPTMRHVLRTHRVALVWSFDRINLDPKIQIRYIDTKHQIADVLTWGSFTRDEWNNLLHLLNNSHFSSPCCAKNFSLISCTKTMAKRMQEQKENNKIVAKSRPMAMNQAVSVSTGSSSVNNPIASKSPGILKASSRQIGSSGKLGVRLKRNSNPDAASSSQGWQRDALLDLSTGELVATDKDQKYHNHPEKICRVGPVPSGYRDYPGDPETPEDSEDSEPDSRIWPHHFHVSPDCLPHMEKVFSIVRQTYDRSPTDDLNDLDVRTAVCVGILSCTQTRFSRTRTRTIEHYLKTPTNTTTGWPGLWGTPVGPGRTPTVQRCPKGKAVGGPHETTSDRRQNDTDKRQDKRAFSETGVDSTGQVLTHTWTFTVWCTFMFATLQAAVHLGRGYAMNLRSVKNQSSKSVK